MSDRWRLEGTRRCQLEVDWHLGEAEQFPIVELMYTRIFGCQTYHHSSRTMMGWPCNVSGRGFRYVMFFIALTVTTSSGTMLYAIVSFRAFLFSLLNRSSAVQLSTRIRFCQATSASTSRSGFEKQKGQNQVFERHATHSLVKQSYLLTCGNECGSRKVNIVERTGRFMQDINKRKPVKIAQLSQRANPVINDKVRQSYLITPCNDIACVYNCVFPASWMAASREHSVASEAACTGGAAGGGDGLGDPPSEPPSPNNKFPSSCQNCP